MTRFRRIVFQLHFWLGLLSGLYIFVVCVTGAALVFRIDLQRALHPHLFTPTVDGPLVDPATVMERISRAYPDWRLSGVEAPTTARPTYLAYATIGSTFVTILIDPVTAHVLGELPERSMVRTLQDLHFDLLAGRRGRVVNGAGAGCIILMALSGLVIWWPGLKNLRPRFTVSSRRGWRRFVWDLHGLIGVSTVIFTLGWAVTGLYFVFPSQLRAAVNAVSPLTVSRAPQSAVTPAGSVTRPTWREMIERAQQELPEQFVARVVVPANERGAFLVMFARARPTPAGSALTSVYLDQFTGARLAAASPARRSIGDAIIAWLAPLHVGSFGGYGVKLAWLLIGLAPPLLFATGFTMWWARVVRPRLMKR